MNCNSVRNRPMPPQPVSSMCGRSITRPALSSSLDRLSVLADAGLVAQLAILRLPPGAEAHALRIGRFHFRRRADVDRAGRAVDDDRVVRIGDADGVLHFADRRDAERARDDGDVRVGGAFLQHQAAQPLAVVVEQRRRPHRARDRGWRCPAAGRATAHDRGPSAGASAGGRGPRGRAAARAGKDRSSAACARGCPTARARRRLPQ